MAKASSQRALLRRRLRARRRELTPAYRRRASITAARRLVSLPAFRRAQRIAVYWTLEPEMDTQPLVAQALKRGKRVYFPLLGPPPGHRLTFASWRQGEKLLSNRYGIAEPRAGRAIRPRFLDLIVLPLVGFDPAGNRLGMGGGYYDRTLEYLSHRRRWQKPRLIGLAYECQRVETLPRERWDVAIDSVVTERAVVGNSQDKPCTTG